MPSAVTSNAYPVQTCVSRARKRFSNDKRPPTIPPTRRPPFWRLSPSSVLPLLLGFAALTRSPPPPLLLRLSPLALAAVHCFALRSALPPATPRSETACLRGRPSPSATPASCGGRFFSLPSPSSHSVTALNSSSSPAPPSCSSGASNSGAVPCSPLAAAASDTACFKCAMPTAALACASSSRLSSCRRFALPPPRGGMCPSFLQPCPKHLLVQLSEIGLPAKNSTRKFFFFEGVCIAKAFDHGRRGAASEDQTRRGQAVRRTVEPLLHPLSALLRGAGLRACASAPAAVAPCLDVAAERVRILRGVPAGGPRGGRVCRRPPPCACVH